MRARGLRALGRAYQCSHKYGFFTGAFALGRYLKAVETQTGTRDPDADPGAHPDAIQICLAPGSLMLAKGTLWHSGGANKSDAPRLILTPQYCPGWVRPLENMSLSVPKEIAAELPQRARELIGYSIHSPFMGYVNGVHAQKSLQAETKKP